MGITSQSHFTGEPNYILFIKWLKTHGIFAHKLQIKIL